MKVVFDVGCMDGAQGLEKVLEYGDPDYRLYAFEAHPEWAQVARQKFAAVSPNCVLVEMAASDTNGTASFHMCRRHGASSLLKFKDDQTLSKYWPGRDDILYSGRSVTVNTTRLDSFLDRNPVPQIDYLNINAPRRQLARPLARSGSELLAAFARGGEARQLQLAVELVCARLDGEIVIPDARYIINWTEKRNGEFLHLERVARRQKAVLAKQGPVVRHNRCHFLLTFCVL